MIKLIEDRDDIIVSEDINSEEEDIIKDCFKKAGVNVLSTSRHSNISDGVMYMELEVECDNSNPTEISYLRNYLNVLESDYDIGYEVFGNGNGFYGKTYSFYHYVD